MPQAAVAQLLHDAALAVERSDSVEGTVLWTALPEIGQYDVVAAVRIGPGISLVGEFDGTIPAVLEHAAGLQPLPTEPSPATLARADTIRARMRIDIGRVLGMASNETVDELVDEASFYVEHLLAELEVANSVIDGLTTEAKP